MYRLRLNLGEHRLGRDPAGPEQRDLVRREGHRVAVVGPRQVADADQRRIAQVQRCAMGHREAAGDLDRPDRLGGLQRPHRYHRGPGQATARPGSDGAAVHRHVAPCFEVAQADAGVEQRLFEGERAADGEGDEIRFPEGADVAHLDGLLTASMHPVARQVAAHVDIRAEPGEVRRAGFADVEQRAGPGVQGTEAKELVGPGFLQDHQVGLQVALAEAAGMAGVVAAADQLAQDRRRQLREFVEGRFGHGGSVRWRTSLLAGL